MSAIFGIINKNGALIEQQSISAMQQALMHRAVDGRDTYINSNVLLGNHRLIISTTQTQERLPLEEGDLVITSDASIHNRDELITRLGIGEQQRLNYPDSRLILNAYRKWEELCLDYIEGEFAFVVWNKVSGHMFAAVDHIGFRPLYYYNTAEQFIFSSEMKGVVAAKSTRNIFNEEILIDYFFRQSDQSRTYNSEIFLLRGGDKLTVKKGDLKIEKYWEPGKTGKYNFTKDADWAECLRDLLIKAVEYRMQTDMPVGVTLSGGLDSSSVACIAGKILEKRNKPLYAFSSVLPLSHKGIEADERKHISIVGKHLKNLDQTFVEAPGDGPFTNLEQAFRIEETLPNAFFYMDQALNRAAADKGVKLLLSGMGGDFFVSWKGNQVVYKLLSQFNGIDALKIFLQTRKYEQKPIVQLLKTEIIAHTGLYKRIAPMLHRNRRNWIYETTLNRAFFEQYKRKLTFGTDTDQKAFMRGMIREGNIGRFAALFTNRDAAYGMTAAMPMFDKTVLDFMFDVPIGQFRVDGGRRTLIRRAMEGILPDEIRWRKDKLPYSPDYVSRIVKNKQFINDVINSEEYNFVWKYIDKESISANIDKMKPHAGMTVSSEISGIRIIQGVISCVFLKWLSDNGYDI